MNTDLLKYLRQPLRSKIKLNKKVFVFIVCLVISFISWLQINLSKQYIQNIPVKFDFVNLPKSKFGSIKISDTLYFEMEVKGFNIMKYKLKNVSIDFKKLKKDNSGEYYFLPNNFLKTVGIEIGENFKVLRANLDTLQFNSVPR